MQYHLQFHFEVGIRNYTWLACTVVVNTIENVMTAAVTVIVYDPYICMCSAVLSIL